MTIALLVSLLAAVVSGMAVYGAEERRGPLAGLFAEAGGDYRTLTLAAAATEARAEESESNSKLDGSRSELLEGVHGFFANLTFVLAACHIAAVLLASVVHRENLIKAMITGLKRP